MTTCPLCPITRATPGELAAHLSVEHGLPPKKALDEARKAGGEADLPDERADEPGPDSRGPDSTPPPVVKSRGRGRAFARAATVTPTNVKPASFSQGRRERADSGRASTAPHDLPKEPPMPSCGYCHRKDGTHSPNCKKGPCKICARMAPRKCGFHASQGGKPGPKGARSGRGPITTIHESFLDRLKVAIAEHERKAAALREALEILETT